LKNTLIRVLLAADETRQFCQRIFTALRRCCWPPKSAFKLVKINHRTLFGDGLTHTFTSKCGAATKHSSSPHGRLFCRPTPHTDTLLYVAIGI
jgi:hypothetical protein